MSSIRNRIRRHLSNPESDHRRIAVGFLWVSLFSLVGKLASAAKEMTIAWRYGVSETVDAYVFVTNLIALPVSIWFGVLSVVLLPLVARVRAQSPSDLPKFRAELLGLTLAAGLGFGCLAYVGFPWLLNTGLSGFSGPTLAKALSMSGPLSLLLPFGAVISLFSAWLMANGHNRNTLLEALPALTILGALLMPYAWVPEPLIWGTVAGLALQLAGLGWPIYRAGQMQSPVLGFQSPAWAGFWGSFGIMAAGQAFMGVTGLIDQLFAAHLGAGAISQLSYANRILSLIVSIGATAISRSTLPIFSELAGQGKLSDVQAITIHWAKLMLILGLVAMSFAWWLAPRIVELLFQRGAFTPSDTLAVAELVRLLVLQLPLYFSGIVFVSLLSVQKRYATIQRVAIANLIVKVIAMILLTPILGIQAIALSTSFMYLSSTVMLYVSSIKMSQDV